ncbi:hypothetical protein REPUB_Repub16aG0037500 [Reevesia pubescens]
MLTKSNAAIIGNKVGKVVEIEDPLRVTDIGIIHFKVWVCVHKPLLDGFWIPTKEGERIWAKLKYEISSDFCFSCGKLEHLEKNCVSESRAMAESSLADHFSPLVRAISIKACNRVGECLRIWLV